MALCVAGGIQSSLADPITAIGDWSLAWAPTAKDVGNTIQAALAGYRGDWAAAARSTPQARSGRAAGNGSLMRTLPVALTYRDRERMLSTSARLSAMTHRDPQAEICCAVYCLWVGALLRGLPVDEAWQAALTEAHEVAGRGAVAPDTPGPSPLPPGFWGRLADVESRSFTSGDDEEGRGAHVSNCGSSLSLTNLWPSAGGVVVPRASRDPQAAAGDLRPTQAGGSSAIVPHPSSGWGTSRAYRSACRRRAA